MPNNPQLELTTDTIEFVTLEKVDSHIVFTINFGETARLNKENGIEIINFIKTNLGIE